MINTTTIKKDAQTNITKTCNEKYPDSKDYYFIDTYLNKLEEHYPFLESISEDTKNMTKERNFKVWVIAIGVINIQNGKTDFDWSIYDYPDGVVYLTNDRNLLYASPDTFKIGDKYNLYSNDGNRNLSREGTIIDKSHCIKENVIEMLLKNEYDYRILKAFKKKKFSRKLRTSYSVKGHDYMSNYTK